jgi:hypothetical protein
MGGVKEECKMLRRALPAALAATLLAGCTGGEPAGTPVAADPPDGGWELVWFDDFEGDSLDRTKWRPEVSCWGGGNDERQCRRATHMWIIAPRCPIWPVRPRISTSTRSNGAKD